SLSSNLRSLFSAAIATQSAAPHAGHQILLLAEHCCHQSFQNQLERDNGRDSKETICDKWSHTSPSKPHSSDRQCAAEKWIALSFLHPLQQKVGQITDFAPVQQMCVTKPVLSVSDKLRVELAGEDGEDSDMFVVFYTKMTRGCEDSFKGESIYKSYKRQARVTTIHLILASNCE
ncbi:hypothetical protein HID58_067511, partial [Brassica napus]